MATAISDEWTEDKCIQLIREYRRRPILWDPKNAYFFKKTMKPATWEEIAYTINAPASACKRKMIILMSSFRREKAKIMHNFLDGKDTGGPYKSTWFAFKEMSFLLDKETERKRQLSGIHDDDFRDDSKNPILKNFLPMRHMQAAIRKAPRKSIKNAYAVRKQTPQVVATKLQEENEKMLPQVQPSTGQTQTQADDEIGSFATFIANKMKKYTEKTKNAVQQAICDVIFKADQNFYENCENLVIVSEEDDSLSKSLQYNLLNDAETAIKSESDLSD